MSAAIEIPTAPHPGATLKRQLQQLNRPKTEVARLLGVSRQSLYDVLAGKQSITAGMALRLGRLTATSPEMWLKLQQSHDVMLAKRRLKDCLCDIPVIVQRW